MNNQRRLVLRYVLSVVALHAVAIAVYTLFGIAHVGEPQRRIYLIAWTAMTLGVVLIGLGRIRKARLLARRSRS